MAGQRPKRGGLTRRDFLVVSGGATAGLILSSCGGGASDNPAVSGSQGSNTGGASYDGPKVELAFWNGFTGGDGPYMKDLVEQFSSENDSIDVKMIVQEWVDFYQKVPQAVASGSGPDVAIMHIDQLATNAARSVIIPLDDVAQNLGLEESDFAPIVWQAGLYNESRYGIPLDVHPLGFYYNKKVMEEGGLDPDNPPMTNDDYMAALEDLKAKGIQGHWQSPFLFTGGLEFQALLRQYGGDLYNEDATEAAFNSDAGVQALTWMVDLVEKGYSPKNVGQDAEHVAFTNDKNAFIWNGIWQINFYGKEVPGLEWGVTQLPVIGNEKAAWAGSHNFVIPNKRGQDPNKVDAAKVFINWVIDHSVEWAKGGQVPASVEVRDSSEFKSLEEQSAFAEQLPYVHFPPPVPGIADAQAAIDTAVNEAVLLKKEPEEALDNAATVANELLAENAEKYQS
jgi:multiple sugar transport system substrate-binding protein